MKKSGLLRLPKQYEKTWRLLRLKERSNPDIALDPMDDEYDRRFAGWLEENNGIFEETEGGLNQ